MLLRETREELAKADSKASILLAGSGIAFGAVLAAGDKAWFPDQLTHHSARVVAWIAVAATMLGIILVGAAVKPRLRSEPRRTGRVDYFGDVVTHRPRWWHLLGRKQALAQGREQFSYRLSKASGTDDYRKRLDDQIWHISHIADRKYRLISIGMWLYAVAAISGICGLVLEKQWL